MINNCVQCGATFEAKSKNALYCPTCRNVRKGYKRAKRKIKSQDIKDFNCDNKFVNTLLKLIAERGLSICQASKAMGLGATGFNNWLYGAGTPNMKSLIIISKFFDVSIDYLVFGEDKR